MAMTRLLLYKPEQSYGELSNFFMLRTPVHFMGKQFSSTEHLFQFRKFVFDGASPASMEFAELVRCADTPYKAKLLASQRASNRWGWMKPINDIIEQYRAKGVSLRSDWESVKVDVMRECLLLKFESDLHCREILLQTGEVELVEHSPVDRFWGGGGDGSGKNMLGLLLQDVRRYIQDSPVLRNPSSGVPVSEHSLPSNRGTCQAFCRSEDSSTTVSKRPAPFPLSEDKTRSLLKK